MNIKTFPIQFINPSIFGKDLYYISQAIHNSHSAGDGEFTKKRHRFLEQDLGVLKIILTTIIHAHPR
jgi:dTDP-4-amino-4,6-dideoxygalactose transaminase